MNIEEQENFQKIIDDDFETMRKMLTRIQENVAKHPVSAQLAFMSFIKHCIVEAHIDSQFGDEQFLGNYASSEGWDNLSI